MFKAAPEVYFGLGTRGLGPVGWEAAEQEEAPKMRLSGTRNAIENLKPNYGGEDCRAGESQPAMFASNGNRTQSTGPHFMSSYH